MAAWYYHQDQDIAAALLRQTLPLLLKVHSVQSQ